MKTWFLCLQQTDDNRYGSVTSDPTLLDDVVIALEFQHHAKDWTWFDSIRLHSIVVVNDQNPNGYSVEDWEQGRCEVIGDAIYPAPAEPPHDDGEDYSHWNEEADIVRRMENPEIDGRDYPPDPYDDY